MARVLLPHFVFLWIPGSEAEAVKKEEQNLMVYENAMKLFNRNRCKHDFFKIESFQQLIETLDRYGKREDENGYANRYKPIFILTGHGQKNTGFMKFMKPGSGSLVPRLLINNWRPQIQCDFIATQCYSNCFLNFNVNPCLLQMDSVRWIPISDAIEPTALEVLSVTGTGKLLNAFHVELMSLLETYLITYPELIEPDKNQCNFVRKAFDVLKTSVLRKRLLTSTQEPPLSLPSPLPLLPSPTGPFLSIGQYEINPYYMIFFILMLGSFIGTPILLCLLFIFYIIIPRIDREKLFNCFLLSIATGIPPWLLYIVSYFLPNNIATKDYKIILVFYFIISYFCSVMFT